MAAGRKRRRPGHGGGLDRQHGHGPTATTAEESIHRRSSGRYGRHGGHGSTRMNAGPSIGARGSHHHCTTATNNGNDEDPHRRGTGRGGQQERGSIGGGASSGGRRGRRSQGRGGQQQRRRRGRTPPADATMDDVLVQLRKQREEARARRELESSRRGGDDDARQKGSPGGCGDAVGLVTTANGKGISAVGGDEDGDAGKKNATSAPSSMVLPPPLTSALGRYRYDPVRGAYFPASVVASAGGSRRGTKMPDYVVQRMNWRRKAQQQQQKMRLSRQGQRPREKMTAMRHVSAVLRLVLCRPFGAATLPLADAWEEVAPNGPAANNESRPLRNLIPSSSSVHALLEALSYCSSASRRASIGRDLAALVQTRGCSVVPTAATASAIRRRNRRLLRVVSRNGVSNDDEHDHRKGRWKEDDGNDVSDGEGGRRGTGSFGRAASNGGSGEEEDRRRRRHRHQQDDSRRPPPLLRDDGHGAAGTTRSASSSLSSRSLLSSPAWYSMLRPLVSSSFGDFPSAARRSLTVPLDCQCKSYLHPTAPTFDVRLGRRGGGATTTTTTTTTTPHVVTIVDGGMHYRSPHRNREQAFAVRGDNSGVDDSGEDREGLISLAPGFRVRSDTYRAVRFAPFEVPGVCDAPLVGAIARDAPSKQYSFTMSVAEPVRTPEAEFLNYSIVLAEAVNDFVFAPHSTWGAPGRVAFAPSRLATPLFLDLESMETISVDCFWKSKNSDALCVQYDQTSNVVFYGHRNGSISILDSRSASFSYIPKSRNGSDQFGSVASLRVLGTCHGNVGQSMVLAKGSFGSCRIFDLRRLGGDFSPSSSGTRTPSASMSPLVAQFDIPSHLVNLTQSSSCSGVALDPTESMIISPFISSTMSQHACLGIWSLSTESLIGSIVLRDSIIGIKRQQQLHVEYSKFCELCSTVSPSLRLGYESDCLASDNACTLREEKGAWGLWYKCGSIFSEPPLAPHAKTGGIHHVSFPGAWNATTMPSIKIN